MSESLITSKQRVADHGEVFTPAWMVEAMLDLVKDETYRIGSRFLEPACGSGNFLVKILKRKLAQVEREYGKSDFEKRHFALFAVMCIYGIELLSDNISECRANLLEILAEYLQLAESDDLLIYQNGGTAYVERSKISIGTQLIDKWKIFMGYAAPGTGNKDTYPHRIISTPFMGGAGSISSETYLCIGPLDSKVEAESVLSYLSCRLTRLLILLHKPSQHVTRKVYIFVPMQDWSKKWTDEDLYAKYGITADEIAFIEKVVRPMNLGETSEDE